MCDLVQEVRVRVEYTQTVQASQALSGYDFNNVLNDAKDEIMACIGHSQHVSAGSATEALALIMGSPFNADQEADCASNDYRIEHLRPSNWASQPAIVFVLPPLLPTHTVGSHGGQSSRHGQNYSGGG